uniref:Uncharacterized protein n=1 Tax=Parascaris equorum TaxID=6256 RepID=A0A914RBJ6_PAREQ
QLAIRCSHLEEIKQTCALSIRLINEVSQLVENRRRELLESVRLMRDQKRKFCWLAEMEKSLGQFGAVSGSTTFPTQCTVELQDSASIYTETRLLLTTFDVDGKRRNSGGDPVKAEIRRGKVSAEQFCDTAVESISAVI